MKLPDLWVWTTIGEIAEQVNGRAFKPSDWSDKGLPIIRIQNLNRADLPFNHFLGAVAERHLVKKGDLLFAWSGTPGTSFGAHIWRGDLAVLNQHIFNIRVDSELVDKEFLAAAINRTLDAQIAKAHGGAGLRHVTKAAFEATPIPLPPVAEQRRIVARLRSYELRISSVRQSLDQAELAGEQGRAALLAGAYDLSLLPSPAHPTQQDRVELVTVGDVATEIAYGSSAKSAPAGEVVVLRMGNIRAGELDWSNLVYSSDPAEIARYRLLPGDVLFNRTNGSPQLVGKSAVYRGEHPAIHAGYLIRIRCSDRILPDYLGYCLNSPAGRAYWEAVRSDSSGQSNVNARKLAAFRLPCPPINDQQAICDAVASGLRRSRASDAAAANARAALEELRVELLEALLTGQFATGDPGDEPAAIQLEGLRAARQRPQSRGTPKSVEAAAVQKTVLEVLRQASAPLPAQELATLCGIRADAELEDIEPFYAELRLLAEKGQLHVEAVRSDAGLKLGERLALREGA